MKDWKEFKAYLDTTKVIDTHEHYCGKTLPEENIFSMIMGLYMKDDMANVAGSEEVLFGQLMDDKITFDEKCKIFFKYYEPVKHTGYADALRRGMKLSWGVDITHDGLHQIKENQSKRTEIFHDNLIEKYNIKAGVCDMFCVFDILNEDFVNYSSWARFAISVPEWHDVKNRNEIRQLSNKMQKNSVINSLDDFKEVIETCIKRCIEKKIFVSFKDQSPYLRKINYKNPTKHEAEKVFNKLMYNAKYTGSNDELRPLNDYLYHFIVRLAGKYNMPFQHHTGHLAGLYGDVRGANAALLTPVIDMYPNVTFDLFHGNWPYMGEYLYLGKSYPNVRLNLCWLHSIDADYSVELMRRLVLSVPTTNVSAFGGDTLWIEHQIGALDQARENVARALISLVNDGKLDMDEAKKIADDWFFNNPNRIFNLNL